MQTFSHDARRMAFVPICLALVSDSTITNNKYPALPRHGSADRSADDRIRGLTAFPSPGTVYPLKKCDVFIPCGMEIMLSTGRREPRLLAGAVCFAVSGIASAGGVDGAYSNLLIAAIAPIAPIEVVPPIPEPSQYIFRYAMQFESYRDATAAFNPSDFYSAPVAASEPFKRQAAASSSYAGYQHPLKIQTQSQSALSESYGLVKVTPTLSLLDRFQLTDDTAPEAEHPHRRLAVLIDDWRVSASARVPLLSHSHDVGASVNVQHKF
ncbi:hypothetical protein [Paraburkholderia dinghuensis]|uniref:Uncharacterized protein n=1 Tax=Paraburkholderia dinghuensis TaxID=2305225 RepID=A0A3N6MDY3_9BURK|nr:hypothetical protein [Paraburkholderia dinghuensis]RQH02079.1 hypothetical protein D1Y85_22555 [Paraburkholderia dinghuensis]